MLISVNNQLVPFTSGTSLSGLLLELRFAEKKGIAVAVNQQIVHRSTWSTYPLQENDKVTIIQATQGG
ncbi:sulfur carrier protein ThiS [Rufibacter immobilis]|uniref:Sulfur carrier protein ThiS n=1 Tax=Rufibacter immobilis TaxID=1348778 RepID=A0A3M9MNX6_9BACT|nr:sulfur carrier protein ThiS [Rufibacter immobilis]RNI27230.1 sulfur carrier protein ThiS [Rufibacter immobilis]